MMVDFRNYNDILLGLAICKLAHAHGMSLVNQSSNFDTTVIVVICIYVIPSLCFGIIHHSLPLEANSFTSLVHTYYVTKVYL